jgi:hypothetical protein
MATIKTVTLPDGSTFTMSDWGDYPLHSRAQIDTGHSQDVVVFNYTQSQVIPGGGTAAPATLIDTNMPQPSALPIRHQMIVFAIMIRFDEADSDTANKGKVTQADNPAEGMLKWLNICQNTYFQFMVENTKPYAEGIITHFPAGGGLWFQYTEHLSALQTPSPIPTVWTAYNPNNGEPGAHAARRLAMPIHLGALETFQGIFKFPRGALPTSSISPFTDFGLTAVLMGPRQRPVG